MRDLLLLMTSFGLGFHPHPYFFGEDKSTIRRGKVNAALLRKVAYNIIQLIMMKEKNQEDMESLIFIVDDMVQDWKKQ